MGLSCHVTVVTELLYVCNSSLFLARFLDATRDKRSFTPCFLCHFSQFLFLFLLGFLESKIIFVQFFAFSFWFLQWFCFTSLATRHVLLDNRNRTQKWDESPC